MEKGEEDGSQLAAALDYKKPEFLEAFETNINDDLWIHTTHYTITNLITGGKDDSLTGVSLLDLGCGEGNMSRWAAEQGARKVVGIDMSELQIEKAREKSVIKCNKTAQSSHAHSVISYDVRDVLSTKGPEYGQFDMVIGIHIVCFADTSDKLFRMIQFAACSLKKGGRFVGVRECLDSAAKGPILTKMRVECNNGQGLVFGYEMELNEQGQPYDYCKCLNHFRNSDGSSLTLTNYLVSEDTMIAMFTRAGFHINFMGPCLSCSPEGTKMFPERFLKCLVEEWGKYMWYFDVTKL